MLTRKSISYLEIIDIAKRTRAYSTLRGNLNKKWVRYLKNKKLFDEYIIYLSNYAAVGVEPMSYKELSNLCYNLDRYTFYMQNNDDDITLINVNWKEEFCNFAWKSIKWYDIKNIFLYIVNKGYLKKSS